MSEQEELKLSERICEGIRKAQRVMIERKAKLGEPVVVADSKGQPLQISAKKALEIYCAESGRENGKI